MVYSFVVNCLLFLRKAVVGASQQPFQMIFDNIILFCLDFLVVCSYINYILLTKNIRLKGSKFYRLDSYLLFFDDQMPLKNSKMFCRCFLSKVKRSIGLLRKVKVSQKTLDYLLDSLETYYWVHLILLINFEQH